MKKVKIKNKKKFIFLLIVLLLILLVIILNRNKIHDFLFPIYEVKDRTSNVEKYKKKYGKDVVIGWIRVQGTNIDYPIINNYAYSDYIDNYAWMNGKPEHLSDYMPIYGHNVRNVSIPPVVGDSSMGRFEQLSGFLYFDFAQKNKYIELTYDGKNYLYKIFSISTEDQNDSKSFYYNLDEKNEKTKFINKSLKNSFYKYNVSVNNNDKLVSLITCTRIYENTHTNLKIDGKLVKSSNKGYNYGMHEKESYKKIKKILEGDGEDV